MSTLPPLDPNAEALWKLIAESIDSGKCPSIQELVNGMDAGINNVYFWLGMLVGRGLVQRRDGRREVVLIVHPTRGDGVTPIQKKTVYTIIRRSEWLRRIQALGDSTHSVWEFLESHPIATRRDIAEGTGSSITTVVRHLDTLAFLGIVTLAERESRGVNLTLRHDEVETATLAFPN